MKTLKSWKSRNLIFCFNISKAEKKNMNLFLFEKLKHWKKKGNNFFANCTMLKASIYFFLQVLGIYFFRGGLCRPFFWSVFLKYFSRIGSKVCDVYIQNIRLSKADVLNILIIYFWPDPEKIFGKNTSKKRPAKPPPKKRNSHMIIK